MDISDPMHDLYTGHLNPTQQKVANEIMSVVRTYTGGLYTGGCKAFYTPEQWKDRGEQFGLYSILIVCHDGGDFAPFFDWGIEADSWRNVMNARLKNLGFYAEQCTSWYTSIYPV